MKKIEKLKNGKILVTIEITQGMIPDAPEAERVFMYEASNQEVAEYWLEQAVQNWKKKVIEEEQRKTKGEQTRKRQKEKELVPIKALFEKLKNEYKKAPKKGKLLYISVARATGEMGGAIVDEDQVFNFDGFHQSLSKEEMEFLSLNKGEIKKIPKELSANYNNFEEYVMKP